MKYEEVVDGYKKSLGLLKQVDKKAYSLFINELKKVGAEEVSAIMSQLKYNMRVQESKENGIATDIKCHNLNHKYIKGKSQILRLSIIQETGALSFSLEKYGIFGMKKQFALTLIPLTKKPEAIDETTFAVANKIVKHSIKSRNFYSVSKNTDSYAVSKNDVWNDTTSQTSISSIPEEESILTTPYIGY